MVVTTAAKSIRINIFALIIIFLYGARVFFVFIKIAYVQSLRSLKYCNSDIIPFFEFSANPARYTNYSKSHNLLAEKRLFFSDLVKLFEL
jgi:hypothetical protein